MGFFFRKSVNFGLFRINFSKSGVGVSTGVKGARVSWGPRGKYLSLGRGGFYYRKKLDGKSNPITPPTVNEHISSTNYQSESSSMKYLTIFGIVPSILILGFVAYKCFEVVNTIETHQDFATITTAVANVRDNPSMNSKIIAKANQSEKYPFVGKTENNWSKILVNNDTAFVSGDLVSVSNELTSSITVRRYDDSPNTRYGWLALCAVPLLFWNIFLFRVDKRNEEKQFLAMQEKKLRSLLSDADTLKEASKYRDALQLYKEALQINPQIAEAYFGIASCYFNSKNDEEAISYYKKGLVISPNDSTAIFNLALVYYYAGQDTIATTTFKKVLELDNSNARAHYFLAMLDKDDYMSIDHMEQALEGELKENERATGQKVLQMKYILVGTINNQNNNTEKAKYYFNKALVFGSIQDNKKAYEVAGDNLKQHDIPDLAIRFYDMAGFIPADDVPKTNKIKSKPKVTPTMNNFRREYFNLLRDFQPSLSSISSKLLKDENLVEKLKSGVVNYSDKFINGCILYDCCQILKIISNGKIKKDSLETFGLVLLSSELLDSPSSLTLGYEPVAMNFEDGKFYSMAESMIEISESKKPLDISVQDVKDSKIISTQKFDNILILPTALKILDSNSFDEYASILYQFANIIAKADNIVTKDEEETLKGIFTVTHNPMPEEKNNSLNIIDVDKNETLNEVLSELDSLIGLDGVKEEVKSLINYIKVQKEREKVGLKSSQVSYHCVFTGSPGTGKTTIARVVAKIYLHLGVLKKGHLVETDRSGLIAEYTGQTAVKVNKTVNSALDGVLFIDEAYALVGENQDDYGKEAVATLIKRIEDDRDKLIVILAGYTNEMKTFIDTNPGFKSRFNRFIEFADYTPTEMEAIYKLSCKKLDYTLTTEAEQRLSEVLETAYNSRDKSFGNGRFVRNTFEKTLEKQANRIAGTSTITKEILTTIIADDIPEK